MFWITLIVALVGHVSTLPALPGMLPMATMAPLNVNSMSQMQNMQLQKQTQGQSASTGDASADFGTIQSQQNSNTKTGPNGTDTNAGSLGACSGGNCAVNGAAQLNAQGQGQVQHQGVGQNLFANQGSMFSNGLLTNSNMMANNVIQSAFQKQNQNQISGAAVGSGTAGVGNVTSLQNTQGKTTDDNASVKSSSLGSGAGTLINLSGAVQAKGADQTAAQLGSQASQNGSAAIAAQRPGCVAQGTHQVALNTSDSKQMQSQSQGEGAAVGQGSASEGVVQSGQTSNVDTNSHGTNVVSGSTGQATGKGIKLSGAASSSAQNALQAQSTQTANGQQGTSMNC